MMASEDDDPRIGRVIQDRYRVTEVLSSGGMGVVYRGERVGLGRQVAIKFLHAAFSGQSDFVKRFEREARLMSRLEHPNVVSVIDFGVADSPYIVMDFVSGKTLGELLEDGPLEWRRAAGIARQILAGLAHAHQRGVIHRDIKSANVMLTPAEGAGDHVKLLDFGLAKLRDADQSMSQIVVGTPSYMSPEQAAGKKADARSDLYSTGVILYELLAGEKPFVAEEPIALLQMHMNEPAPRLPRDGEAPVPPAIEAVVRRAMAKDPEDRYQSPVEMQEGLEAALADPHGGDDELEEADGEQAPAVAAAPERAATVPAPARAATVPAPPRAATVPVPRRRRPSSLLWLGALLAGAALWWSAGMPYLDQVRGGVHSLLEEASGATAMRMAEPSLANAEALADSGERDAAIGMLHELRRSAPSDSRIARRLGDLYFEKEALWWTEGLAAYRKALEIDPGLGADPVIARNAIRALGRAESASRARVLLVAQMGRAAVAPLRAAARAQPARRAQIRQLIREIEAR